MPGVSQALYGFAEYECCLPTKILSSDGYFFSLFPARSDSPEPIPPEDDLENQDTILTDDGILEVEGDIDRPYRGLYRDVCVSAAPYIR